MSTATATRVAADPRPATAAPGWGVLAWVVGVLVVGACSFGPAYRGTVLGVPVVVGILALLVVVVGALVVGGLRLGLPRTTLVVSLVLLTAAAGVLASDPDPGRGGTAAWRDTPGLSLLVPLVDSVPRLLSTARPAATTPSLLVPVAVLTVLVTLAVAVVVVPAPTAAAPRVLLAPVLGSVVLYTGGLLLTAGAADRSGVLAGVLVLTAAGGWALQRGSATAARPARARLRGAAVLLAPVLAVAALATVAGAVQPADPFEPRELVQRPRLAVALTSPLPQLATWGDQTDLELLRVSGSYPERLSLAVLPDFSGATWSLQADLREPGAVVVPDLPPGAQRAQVDLQVQELGSTAAPDVQQPGLDLGWLPTAGRAGAVAGFADGDVALDADTGAVVDVAAASAPPGSPVPPRTYRVTGEVDAPDDTVLATAGVPSGEATQRYLDVPSATQEIVDYAQAGTAVATTRLEQAVALEELVRTGRTLDPEVDAGSSVARVQQLLFGAEGTLNAQRGSSEQFASAYALLARSVGLPTRLVVGFEVPPAGPDGSATITSADAAAWPEVYFTGAGWVAFDPTPSADGSPAPSAGQQLLDRLGGSDPQEPGDDPVDPDAAPVAVPTVAQPTTPLLTTVARVAAGLAVVVALAAAALLGLRARRRRRLRAAGAVGAWQHVLDALVLAGHRPPEGRGSTDVADELAARTGQRDVLDLVHRAERAAFAPSRRPGPADRRDWDAAVAVGRALRAGTGRGRRLLWPCSPAPLRAAGRPAPRRALRAQVRTAGG